MQSNGSRTAVESHAVESKLKPEDKQSVRCSTRCVREPVLPTQLRRDSPRFRPLMALNSLYCADVPLSNYSLTHSPRCRKARSSTISSGQRPSTKTRQPIPVQVHRRRRRSISVRTVRSFSPAPAFNGVHHAVLDAAVTVATRLRQSLRLSCNSHSTEVAWRQWRRRSCDHCTKKPDLDSADVRPRPYRTADMIRLTSTSLFRF